MREEKFGIHQIETTIATFPHTTVCTLLVIFSVTACPHGGNVTTHSLS